MIYTAILSYHSPSLLHSALYKLLLPPEKPFSVQFAPSEEDKVFQAHPSLQSKHLAVSQVNLQPALCRCPVKNQNSIQCV